MLIKVDIVTFGFRVIAYSDVLSKIHLLPSCQLLLVACLKCLVACPCTTDYEYLDVLAKFVVAFFNVVVCSFVLPRHLSIGVGALFYFGYMTAVMLYELDSMLISVCAQPMVNFAFFMPRNSVALRCCASSTK